MDSAAATWTDGLRAVVFDYGNTLIEFGTRQVAAINAGWVPLRSRVGAVMA